MAVPFQLPPRQGRDLVRRAQLTVDQLVRGGTGALANRLVLRNGNGITTRAGDRLVLRSATGGASLVGGTTMTFADGTAMTFADGTLMTFAS